MFTVTSVAAATSVLALAVSVGGGVGAAAGSGAPQAARINTSMTDSSRTALFSTGRSLCFLQMVNKSGENLMILLKTDNFIRIVSYV